MTTTTSPIAPTPGWAGVTRRGAWTLPYGWPLTFAVAGLGVSWALGIAGIAPIVFAVPMAWQLLHTRPLVIPPGFSVWLVFLVWVLLSTTMLGVNPPGTISDSADGRLLPVIYRLAAYGAATVVLLYVSNLDLVRYPQRKLVAVMGVGFLWVVAGGVLGMLAPHFEFTSPFELLLPGGIRHNYFVQSLVHPTAAQVQDFLGYAAPRPSAPFGYTNMWGHAFALLLPWFVVAFALSPRRRTRLLSILTLLAAVALAVSSLNRGLWVGLALSVLYIVGRQLTHGRLGTTLAVVTACSAILLVVLASPVGGLAQQRLDNGHSDSVRSYSTETAIALAKESPLVGLGSTRRALGSPQSIAVGRSPACPQCGNFPIGINGHLWYAMVAHGFVGAALYLATFVVVAWRYRRTRTPLQLAAHLTVLLMLWFALVYGALPTPLSLAFIAWGALFREELLRPRGTPTGTTPARAVS